MDIIEGLLPMVGEGRLNNRENMVVEEEEEVEEGVEVVEVDVGAKAPR